MSGSESVVVDVSSDDHKSTPKIENEPELVKPLWPAEKRLAEVFDAESTSFRGIEKRRRSQMM